MSKAFLVDFFVESFCFLSLQLVKILKQNIVNENANIVFIFFKLYSVFLL